MNKMDHSEDNDLRDRLRKLGDDAARRAPSFQRTWCAAQEAHSAPARDTSLGWMRWAIVTAAIACAALLTTLRFQVPGAHDSPKPAITTQPVVQNSDSYGFDPSVPTDFLLANHRDTTASPSVDQLTREINTLLKP